MTTEFILLAPGFWVSPQITADDLAAAKALGVRLVINNRPDGEAAGQPDGQEIEAAARALGLDYIAIPIASMSVAAAQLDAFDRAAGAGSGGVLAYCKSGGRSVVLRAFAEARRGCAVDDIICEAGEAGFGLASLRLALEAAARK